MKKAKKQVSHQKPERKRVTPPTAVALLMFVIVALVFLNAFVGKVIR